MPSVNPVSRRLFQSCAIAMMMMMSDAGCKQVQDVLLLFLRAMWRREANLREVNLYRDVHSDPAVKTIRVVVPAQSEKGRWSPHVVLFCRRPLRCNLLVSVDCSLGDGGAPERVLEECKVLCEEPCER